MKRAILPALGLALLLSLPAISQDEGQQPNLEQQVEALQKKVEEQDAALKDLQAYVDHQKTQAKRLAKSLSAAEEGGFLLPAPNNESKKILLDGLQEYAGVVAGAEPKKDSGEE